MKIRQRFRNSLRLHLLSRSQRHAGHQPVPRVLQGGDEGVLLPEVPPDARQFPLGVLSLQFPDVDQAGVFLDGSCE